MIKFLHEIVGQLFVSLLSSSPESKQFEDSKEYRKAEEKRRERLEHNLRMTELGRRVSKPKKVGKGVSK